MKITRTMVIGDIHFPFNDSNLINTDASGLVLDVADDLNIDRLIINGDMLDFYDINMHGPKHPDVAATLEDELIAGRDFISSLRKRFPKMDIIYNEGNHSNRLNRFILKHSKQLWGLLTVDKYLELERHDVEFYPYNNKYQIEETNCFVQHSPPSYGVNGARTSLLKKLDQTFIYGCTHRVQHACHTAASGEVYDCYFNGWLGSVDETPAHKQVFSYAKGHESWQKSFCIVTVLDKKEYHVNQYNIRNNQVVVDGHIYLGNK